MSQLLQRKMLGGERLVPNELVNYHDFCNLPPMFKCSCILRNEFFWALFFSDIFFGAKQLYI